MLEMTGMRGKVLASVEVDGAKERVTLRFKDGSLRRFRVRGDCCSRSWIEHLESIPDVDGATILDVTESYMDLTGEGAKAFDGHVKAYHTTFKTDRGDIVLEYRNSSNGYYGGYLEEVGEDDVAGVGELPDDDDDEEEEDPE